MALDAHGDLFIADSLNNVVEEVTPAGRLSVVAGKAGKKGSPTPGPATRSALDDPYGVALDAHGDLFIADADNNVVEEVTPAGRLSVVAGDGQEGPPTPGPATRSELGCRVRGGGGRPRGPVHRRRVQRRRGGGDVLTHQPSSTWPPRCAN